MRIFNPVAAVVALGFVGIATAAQDSHDHMKGMETPTKAEKIPAKSPLEPAQGASVKIVSPRAGQAIKGNAVPLEFKMTKGKIGEHVHAYVDGELVGMFQGSKGTLNGIKPGPHTLELRVVTGDHKTELNATDKVLFTSK